LEKSLNNDQIVASLTLLREPRIRPAGYLWLRSFGEG
jgi:hypothetical protein